MNQSEQLNGLQDNKDLQQKKVCEIDTITPVGDQWSQTSTHFWLGKLNQFKVMEKVAVPEMLEIHSVLTWLFVEKDFITELGPK